MLGVIHICFEKKLHEWRRSWPSTTAAHGSRIWLGVSDPFRKKCQKVLGKDERDSLQGNNGIANMKSLGIYLLEDERDYRLHPETPNMSQHDTDVTICFEDHRTITRPGIEWHRDFRYMVPLVFSSPQRHHDDSALLCPSSFSPHPSLLQLGTRIRSDA